MLVYSDAANDKVDLDVSSAFQDYCAEVVSEYCSLRTSLSFARSSGFPYALVAGGRL